MGKEAAGGRKLAPGTAEENRLEQRLSACPRRLAVLSTQWPPHPLSPCILQHPFSSEDHSALTQCTRFMELTYLGC